MLRERPEIVQRMVRVAETCTCREESRQGQRATPSDAVKEEEALQSSYNVYAKK